MQLDKDYRIESNAYGVNLIKEQTSEEINAKTGKPVVYRDAWYFPNQELALKKYCVESLKPVEVASEIIAKIQEQNDMISELFKKQ